MTSRHIKQRISKMMTVLFGLMLFSSHNVNVLQAQTAPRLVPYFVTAVAGNGTDAVFTVGQPCPHGTGLKSLDTYGTGCLAVDASLNRPSSVVVDKAGNIYFGESNESGDWNNSALVKKIDAKTGILSIFAGGAATNPFGPCDSPDTSVPGGGNIYGDGCAATYANFQSIYSLAIDANYLYIADFNGSFIHKVSLSSVPLTGQTYAHEIQVVIGDGTQKTTWVPDGVGSMMYFTSSIAVDASNTQSATKIAFTDDNGTVVRVANLATRLTTTVVGPGCATYAAGCKPVTGCAGTGTISPAGPNSAKTNSVRDLTFDKDGNLFFTESSCLSIREITAPVDGTTQNKLVFGLGVSGGSGLPLYAQAVTAGGTAAHLSAGRSISSDLNSPNAGVLYYMDSGKTIWMYDQVTGWMHQIFSVTGTANTGCGGTSVTPWNNCPAPNATLSVPAQGKISTDQYGNLYIATPDNFVRKIAVGTDFIGTAPASTVSYPGPATQYAMLHGTPVTSIAAAAPFNATPGLTIGTVSAPACSNVFADGLYDCPSTITFTPAINGLSTGALSANAGSYNYPLQAIGSGVPAVVTTTTLTVTPSSVTTGQAVSFTATVVPASTATGIPSGTVSFYNGSTQIGSGTLGASGVVLFSSTSLPAGVYNVTATYSGDNIFSTSTSSSATLTVGNPIATTTNLNASATTSVTGASLTFNVSVVPASGAALPTGNVVFSDGSAVLATVALQAGKASYTTASLSAATHPITAAYVGDTNFYGSVSTIVTITVSNPVATTTNLTSSAPTAIVGTSLTFNASVVPASGSALPTGNVVFSDGSTVLATVALQAGKASYTTTSLSVASHSITAAYVGDTNFKSSVSAITSITVSNPVTTSTTLSASATTAVSGTSIAFTATVTPATGAGSPTGSVTFYDGTVSLGSATLASGSATLTTSTLGVATHSITAMYGGDTGDSPSTSKAVSVVITAIPADFTIALTPASGTAALGSSTTSLLTLTPQGGFAAQVAFSCVGLPVQTLCSFSPATVTPDGVHTSTTTLTLQTNAKTASLEVPKSRGSHPGGEIYAAFTFLGVGSSLGLVFTGRRKRSAILNRIRLCSLLLLSIVSLSAAVGCGSQSSTLPAQTPVGVSTLVVTATSGTIVHTTTFTLTVQ